MSLDSSRSARKSKRSINSKNSKDDGDNNKKKKVTGQKTLGVAWGSNSRSSSRSSFRSSPFADFGSYMAVKNRKLREQFDAEASSSSHSGSNVGKPLFFGVSIFVDGYTVPSSQELRGYMLKYGGHFENYFSRHRVTHIICSNLPNSKVKNLRSFSGGLPVVKPTWVLDCVAANKLLSWIPYQLDQLASETNHQPKLSTFLALKTNPVLAAAIPGLTNQIKSGREDLLVKDGISLGASPTKISESIVYEKQHNRELDALVHENSISHETMIEEATCSNENSGADNISEAADFAAVDSSFADMHPQCGSHGPSVSISSSCLERRNIKESSSSTTVVSSNQGHSTMSASNFMETYFKNSRLHFIGTWRNRYRKHFPSSCDGFRTSNSMTCSFGYKKNAIIHVDMDCFFVSVIVRNRPELWDKPVAVCHSDNPRGTAEISSANYPARNHGVRAGMFVREAKALCPHLVIFPYDFKAYEEVADQFYGILHKYCNKVQAMSCDEAVLDVSDKEGEDPELLASVIRKEIFDTTGCTASAGIAGNMLMARLATRTAKPDGQCYLPPDKVDDFLKDLPVKALPGIGRALGEKMNRRDITTCGQLRMISKESLEKDFGLKTGDMLWNYCRGIDNRLVGMIQESKSIGAEVNWGVRFKELKDCQHFLMNISKEVSLRLQGCGVRGRTVTLKVKKRRAGAEEPTKYMGCGDCENLSHSTTVPMATDDVDVLQRISAQLFGHFHIDFQDIRGMGLQVSKLETAANEKQGNERNSIRSWLLSAPACTKEECQVSGSSGENASAGIEEHIGGSVGQLHRNLTVGANLSNREAHLRQGSALPPLSDLDMDVIETLPPELFSEMNDIYDGMLKVFMLKHKGVDIDFGGSSVSHGSLEGSMNNAGRVSVGNLCASRESTMDSEGRHCMTKEVQSLPVSGTRTLDVGTSASVPEDFAVMPSSLSQVDISVLQQLPEQLRADILEFLPAHRNAGSVSNGSLGPHESHPQDSSHDVHKESRDPISNNDLWVGNPPRWVEKFVSSDYPVLKAFAEMYNGPGTTGKLSFVFLRNMSLDRHCLGGDMDRQNDAIYFLCELLKQYVELKIESDIEEIYTCFCLLRRMSAKSEFFSQVYNTILPHLQATVGENYGGSFRI